jgi:ferredoxin
VPCAGALDFNLIVQAFELGADAVLVCGGPPGQCQCSSNYHAGRRWVLFRALLDILGFDQRRIHFSWQGGYRGVLGAVIEQTRQLGPYADLYDAGHPKEMPAGQPAPYVVQTLPAEPQMREHCRQLLAEGAVDVVVGYGERGPLIITLPEEADRLVWHNRCVSNLTVYLTRKEVKALGRPAVVVKPCDEKSLMVLDKDAQIERGKVHAIGMACAGVGEPKCTFCTARTPRFPDVAFGEPAGPVPPEVAPPNRYGALLAMTLPERMTFWINQFERCVKCYACRQVCPMCYCETCIVDKNRPMIIDPAPGIKGNFAWHVARAFHLAGRCIGCGECSRVCPAGLDLAFVNIALHVAAHEEFGFEPGVDPALEPPIDAYALQES